MEISWCAILEKGKQRSGYPFKQMHPSPENQYTNLAEEVHFKHKMPIG